MRAAALTLCALVACGVGQEPGGPGVAGGPPAPARGRPSGLSAAGDIGAAGGALTLVASDGGQLVLTIAPGAVSATITFTIDEISISGLPGGTGSGYRLGPSGVVLAAPMTLSFTPPPPATPDGLTAAYQGPTGYWSRVYSVARDASALSVQADFLGDWSLVTVATQRDLHGPFRLDSTEGLPFTATGDVTLQYLADGSYLPQGDITLQTPVARGAASCLPGSPATAALPASIADLTDSAFRWGINGEWTLSCDDGSSSFVSTNFDSLGITNLGCARSYLAGFPMLITDTHVQGQYLIDCGAQGRVVASWDLVAPDQTPGALPPPP